MAKLPEELRVKMQTPRGVRDIFGDEMRYFEFICDAARKHFNKYGFSRIELPIFEHTEVFNRSLGGETDIVKKEMYTFMDRGDTSLTLRPEGTASVCRAYLQENMNQAPQPVQLWYVGPFFRYERPQKGRYRQLYQMGAEVIGESSPAIDAQLILLCRNILEDLGLGNTLKLQLNSIGCKDCREKYMADLKVYYEGKERSMCESCKVRREKNVLRLLDCKEEDCVILAKMAPKLSEYLCKDCADFHIDLKKYLDGLGIVYNENPNLVRGLDYYARTVFEFWNDHEGAQNSLCGGGRYDYLMEDFGAEHTPAVGFAFGVDRLISEMMKSGVDVPRVAKADVFVASLGDEAKLETLKLINDLHKKGISCVGAVGKPSMKAQLKLADNLKVAYTLLMGEMEVREGNVLVKNMERGSQEKVSLDKIVDNVAKKLTKKN